MVELPSGPIVRNKSLRTNHACTLCGLYGHYSHHYQDFIEFRMALDDLRQHSLESEITLIEEVHPPPPSSDTMSIYMMSTSTDPNVSTITDSPSDLSLLLFPQPPPQPQLEPQPQLLGKQWGSFPINMILFLFVFLPSRIVSKSTLETLCLQDFTLGDPLWYLKPPTLPLRP